MNLPDYRRWLPASLLCMSLSALPAMAQESSTASTTGKAASQHNLSSEVEQMKAQIASQQKAIEQLQQSLDQMKQMLQSKNQQTQANGATKAPAQQAKAQSGPQKAEQRSDSIVLANGKVRIGALFYFDWAEYYRSGFGPQFLTQINAPGPGNNGYNSFDVNRAYINLFYSPNDRFTFRVTPNIYREIAPTAASSNSAVSAISSSSNGNLTYRLKYAYLDVNKIFGNATFTIGQQQNPLVSWEETLYGFRYVNLTPWNYLSLSSSQTGFALKGPVEYGDKTYLDYQFGIFTQASFHALPQSEQPQFMARVSYYPFGSLGHDQGLGLTAFYDYAHSNVAPDVRGVPSYRLSTLLHYSTKNNASGAAFEFQYGRNAFSPGNLFSGSGPDDSFGIGNPTPYAGFSALASAILGSDHTNQLGLIGFGHLQPGNSPFTLFGMVHYFQPNIKVNNDPIDFYRIIGGVSYKVNKSVRFALDSQNVIYYHRQYTFPHSELVGLNSGTAAKYPNGIANAVPANIQSLFFNLEFSF